MATKTNPRVYLVIKKILDANGLLYITGERSRGQGEGWSPQGEPRHFGQWVPCPSLPWLKRGSDDKESTYKAGDLGSIPGSIRSPGEGNGYPLQYACLGNPVDTGAWQATVHEVAESDMTETFMVFLVVMYGCRVGP